MTRGVRRIDRCQGCEAAQLVSVATLGLLPAVNALNPTTEPVPTERRYPTNLVQCRSCTLVQLEHIVDPEILFAKTYPYTSGTTRALRENFASLAKQLDARLGLSARDLVVDVGSNDGTLLDAFRSYGVRLQGVEPTAAGDLARSRGIPTLQRFFSEDVARQLRQSVGPARVVTATNVMAHVPDILDFLRGVVTLLGKDSLFVSESHYLGDLVADCQFDAIYHEHLRYYSLHSILAIYRRAGLAVVAVERIPTHGGSIRVYASIEPRPPEDSVRAMLRAEEDAGLSGDGWAKQFGRRIAQAKAELWSILGDLGARGERVQGVGAPSRGSTLAAFVGLDAAVIEAVLEIDGSKKIGTYLPGTNVPVISEKNLDGDQPDVLLVFSWHLAAELIPKLVAKGFRGKFLVPLPKPRLVDARDASARPGGAV